MDLERLRVPCAGIRGVMCPEGIVVHNSTQWVYHLEFRRDYWNAVYVSIGFGKVGTGVQLHLEGYLVISSVE